VRPKAFAVKQWFRGHFDFSWSGGRKWKMIVLILIAAVICGGLLYWRANTIHGKYEGLSQQQTYAANPYSSSAYYWKNGLKKYKDANWTSRNGIDVSAYQGDVDWMKVKKAGISFVMIRAGYRGSTNGTISMDKRFASNMEGAEKAGLDVGVYFYSSAVSTEEAVEEAKWTLKQIQHKGITMPVAFDMEEDSSSRTYKLSMTQKTKITDAFCSIVKQNGYKPLIYGNPTWINNSLDLSYLTSYNLWIAHYTNETTFQHKYLMWQYSQSGKLPGITGTVDMDILMVQAG
jgi:GH25 family lysozyme M1 (1,4-beta-N-acetylmuramidase)